jgi:hypothetical protein
MASTKKLNPDNAKSNAVVKSRPAKNRRAGASAVAYRGIEVTKAPAREQRRRLKEAAIPAIPLAAIGGAALYSIIKNTKR